MTVTVAERSEPPPEPVTVREYEPTGVAPLAKMVSVDVETPFGVSATSFGLKNVESPGNEAVPVRLVIQQKPFRLETVTVVVAEEPS